jgi:hypothetical protein
MLRCRVALSLLGPTTASAASDRDPSFMHGAGQVVAGVLLEFPKTVLQGTVDGPPVVGTLVGALAGVVHALQKTAGGLVEMSAGFNPWGAKRRNR